jgi:hypothetical protein
MDGRSSMDYCNGVQGFINFATSILRNFSGGSIRCPRRKCKNKKYMHPDVVTMHLPHKWPVYGGLLVLVTQRIICS